LDGLALLKLVSEVRTDLKIVVNEILMEINAINEFFLPVNIFTAGKQNQNLEKISASLAKEEAVIIFPAGEVSRLTTKGIRDRPWSKGVLLFARKFDADILPVFIQAKNTLGFYLVSAIWKKFSIFLLPGEMFRKTHKNITITIGEPIPSSSIFNGIKKSSLQIKLLKKHLYKIGKNQKGIFKTSRSIVQPMPVKSIRKRILESEFIGEAHDGKQIYLVEPEDNSIVIQEIARLREITFRKVGEGTGTRKDMDKFDKFYSHLVVWDNKESEIIGSYRLGLCRHLLRLNGKHGLYTSTLFDYSSEFMQMIPDSIELGRSFIQTKYWNTNALDLLWQGLGSYISTKPHLKYLFGGVSISGMYPPEAAAMIVFVFNKWYGSKEVLATSKNRYIMPEKTRFQCENLFTSENKLEDIKNLKIALRQFNVSIPPLLKHYTNLCHEGGVQFLDFGVDPDFGNCIDGFILLDLSKMKAEKKERYILRRPVDKVA
jgi:putative hemolysin